MAIQIIKPLDKSITYNANTYVTKFIAGYNDNIIRWTSDTPPPSIPGRKTRVSIYLNDMRLLSVGNQFKFNCNGTDIIFTIATTPVNENELKPYSAYGSLTSYAYYLQGALGAHSVLSATFNIWSWYWPLHPPGPLTMRFESVNNANVTMTGSVISGTFSFNNGVMQVGATDFQSEMLGAIWFNNTYKFVDLTSINNIFEFNILEVVKTIFGKFDDTTTYQNSDVVKFDTNLFLKLDIKLIVTFTDPGTASDEELNLFSYITRAVRQHTDVFKTSMFHYEPNRIFNISTSDAKTLALIKGGEKATMYSQHLRIFKGFPFDISVIAEYTNDQIYLAANRPDGLTLNNITKIITTPLPDKTDKYVQRIILSDGQNLHDVFVPLTNYTKGKLNIISTTNFGTKDSQYTFELEIVDECGIYIKWLNAAGGWSYWLFNKQHRIVHSTKQLGTVNQNAGQLSFSADEINIGFDADKKLQVVAQYLQPWALEQILELSTSPCVYVYMKPKGTSAYNLIDSWLKLPNISNFKFTEDSTPKTYKISFEFQLPKIFTQTL